jgi:dTDP-4-dehydrorhamnose reductase
VLAVPGWWRRPERLLYPPVPRGDDPAAAWSLPPEALTRPTPAQPILITGAGGTLGQAFARLCQFRALSHVALTRPELDIANTPAVEKALAALRPWAVINCSGFVRVDEAEREPAGCWRANTQGPARLARACAQQGVALLTFSSDLVFDGQQTVPYVESSPPAPLNVYGATKATAEQAVALTWPQALLVRTSAFIGPWDPHNFLFQALLALAAGQPFRAAADVTVSPTYLPDLAHACLDLLIDGESGLWHLANPGAFTWADLARQAAEQAGVSTETLVAVPAAQMGWQACRPAYSVLGSERGVLLPPLETVIERYLRESEVTWAEVPAAAEVVER